VHGTEITRSTPPGHFNALFVKDAFLIDRDTVWDNFEEAMFAGRTLVGFRKTLAEKKEYTLPFSQQCISEGGA